VNSPRPITAILFTWSWGGFVVRYTDGAEESTSPGQLLRQVGAAEYDRLPRLAHRLDGHWQPVEEQD
jgi:hypothetical protein